MKIVFAQGNPDTKYVRTRHNTGFLVLDAVGEKYGATWRDIDKYKGRISDVTINGEKVLLVKPLSYYNDTGLVARTLTDYYKLDPAKDFLVVHDDLALPLGTVRVRESGSDAGNNGIKSLNLHLGPEYPRIRIGIWTEARDTIDDVNFVLGTFPKAEFDKLEKDIIPHAIALIEKFVAGTLEASSTSV
ncbi:MAG TPA: aminoacyl-tRNA hydrolase [Candidatus Microsaccharimonas sp.]